MLKRRGWLEARKLKTGMCGGGLSVAYILTGVRGVKGNDDHLNTIAILLVIFPSRVGLADVA